MSAVVALSTELAALAARVLSLENSRTADEAAFKALLAEVIVDEGKIAALTPAPVIVPPPIVDPQVQWKATMASGTLSDWDEQVNSGSANTDVVTPASVGIPPMGGSYVMRQAVAVGGGGTRMHRYAEVDRLSRAGTKYYWSWWDFFPTPLSFPVQNTWIIWGLESVKSATVGTPPDPFYSLVFNSTGNTLNLVFNPSGLTVGLPTKVVYTSNVPVPVGQWNFFEAEILPRGDTTGSLKIWMNQQAIFTLSGVLTQWPYVGQQPLLSVIEQTGYGDVPFTHYVDDVTVSLGRLS